MSTASTTSLTDPARLSDSPWYWVYLFCTAGLIALVLAGPKFAARQSQIERSAQGRQRAVQNLSGEEPTTQLSTEENTHIRLRPLYYVLGALLAFAWIKLGWKQLRRRQALKSQMLPPSVASKSPR
jgi:hypothetical protein